MEFSWVYFPTKKKMANEKVSNDNRNESYK